MDIPFDTHLDLPFHILTSIVEKAAIIVLQETGDPDELSLLSKAFPDVWSYINIQDILKAIYHLDEAFLMSLNPLQEQRMTIEQGYDILMINTPLCRGYDGDFVQCYKIKNELFQVNFLYQLNYIMNIDDPTNGKMTIALRLSITGTPPFVGILPTETNVDQLEELQLANDIPDFTSLLQILLRRMQNKYNLVYIVINIHGNDKETIKKDLERTMVKHAQFRIIFSN